VRVVGTSWERANAWEARVGATARTHAFLDSPFARALDGVMVGGVPLLALVVGLELLGRWRRGERRIAVLGVGTIGGAVLTAELLKLTLSTRAGVPDFFTHGYPSGHTTTAFSTSLVWAWTAPRSRRFGPIVPAAAYTAFVAAGVLVDGWHLPSDVAGALGLTAAWFLGLLVVVRPPADPTLTLRDSAAATVAAAAVMAGFLVHFFVPAGGEFARLSKEAALLAAAAALVATLAVLGLARR
jgi:membrane-associated phospholipid phosphatase